LARAYSFRVRLSWGEVITLTPCAGDVETISHDVAACTLHDPGRDRPAGGEGGGIVEIGGLVLQVALVAGRRASVRITIPLPSTEMTSASASLAGCRSRAVWKPSMSRAAQPGRLGAAQEADDPLVEALRGRERAGGTG
jgi:hypothetical protein